MRLFEPALIAVWLCAYGSLVVLTDLGNHALALPARLIQDQAVEDDGNTAARFSRRLLAEGIYELSYAFLNFNQDEINIVFTIVQSELDSAIKEFGWRKSEVDAVLQHKKNVGAYFASRGFRVLSGDEVQADIPLMVRRNRLRVKGLALALERGGQARGYASEDVVGAATAMVQTAVTYKIPPAVEKGLHIAGVFPPPRALVGGWGDCDTKTALLGSLLSNWDGIKAVGLSLPKHYLMALRAVPRQGDAYVEYDGAHYVLIESAGPAWLAPGTVGVDTQDMLDRMNGIPIQPF